jgi:hypothetical protein
MTLKKRFIIAKVVFVDVISVTNTSCIVLTIPYMDLAHVAKLA